MQAVIDFNSKNDDNMMIQGAKIKLVNEIYDIEMALLGVPESPYNL